MQRSRLPNWQKWRHIPNAKIWEAVALSMNIDPDLVRHNRSWAENEYSFDESGEFRDRVVVAKRNIGVKGGLSLSLISLASGMQSEVNLAAFAAWAMSINWEIPAELAEIAKSDSPKPQSVDVLGGKGRASAMKLIIAMAMAKYRYD